MCVWVCVIRLCNISYFLFSSASCPTFEALLRLSFLLQIILYFSYLCNVVLSACFSKHPLNMKHSYLDIFLFPFPFLFTHSSLLRNFIFFFYFKRVLRFSFLFFLFQFCCCCCCCFLSFYPFISLSHSYQKYNDIVFLITS